MQLKVRLSSGGGNGVGGKKQSSGGSQGRDLMRRVKRELSDLETALPWHMVDCSWKQRRNGWRARVKNSETVCALSNCLKELIGVRRTVLFFLVVKLNMFWKL